MSERITPRQKKGQGEVGVTFIMCMACLVFDVFQGFVPLWQDLILPVLTELTGRSSRGRGFRWGRGGWASEEGAGLVGVPCHAGPPDLSPTWFHFLFSASLFLGERNLCVS